MEASQQFIDNLIAFIDNAEDPGSVTNQIVAAVLAHLNTGMKKSNFILQIVDEDGFFYADLNGDVAFQYTPAHGFDAAKVSRHFQKLTLSTIETAEDGFYYADINGDIAMKYTPSDGFDVAKVSRHFLSLLGETGIDTAYQDLNNIEYNI